VKKRKAKSEFGEGLVQQLCYFTNHFDNEMAREVRSVVAFANRLRTNSFGDCQKKLPLKGYARVQLSMIFSEEPKLFRNLSKSLSKTKREREKLADKLQDKVAHMIELWANGASDHLYGIKLPDKNPTKLNMEIFGLRSRALAMGHGFNDQSRKLCTMENFEGLIETTKTIARMIDRRLGVKSDPGQWQ